jgi:hypothetical protein
MDVEFIGMLSSLLKGVRFEAIAIAEAICALALGPEEGDYSEVQPSPTGDAERWCGDLFYFINFYS